MVYELSIRPGDILKALDLLDADDVHKAIQEGLNDTANVVESVARREAKPHGVDTGQTARSIVTDTAKISGISTPLWAKVSSNQRGIHAVEEGRAPGGKMPPLKPIADWARRHGIAAPPFVIARAIAIKGTKGLHMFRTAYKAGEDVMEKLVRARLNSRLK